MAELSAVQIVERIANANGTEPNQMRKQIEENLQNMISNPGNPYFSLVAELFPDEMPSMDELIVEMQYELYEELLPTFPGWKWDGEGYRRCSPFEK